VVALYNTAGLTSAALLIKGVTSMRRTILLVVTMLFAVLVIGGVAYALTIQCDGTNGPDKLVGTNQPDRMNAFQDDDQLLGGRGGDTMYGDDMISANTIADGNDKLYGNAGSDTLFGFSGSDVLRGAEGGTTQYKHGIEEEPVRTPQRATAAMTSSVRWILPRTPSTAATAMTRSISTRWAKWSQTTRTSISQPPRVATAKLQAGWIRSLAGSGWVSKAL
jgi:Ca2+-binding RTX toxin-like protein